MKRFATILLLFAATLGLHAQENFPRLSDSAFASVITCGVGNEYYLSWGHAAIRICDPAQHIDLAYNYGTFDFDTPHFYWRFACGDLNYCLSRVGFDHFLAEYIFEKRAVWEQRLRLTPQELNNLFILLETNYLPEYRYYKYDFFRDNCATRVRDIIATCLVHRTLSPEITLPDAKTYRDYLYEPTEQTRLWWRMGVDITLGMRCDKRCTNYETMFSPIEMMHTFDTMTVDSRQRDVATGQRTALAEPARQLLPDMREPLSNSFPPDIVFCILFVIVLFLTVMEWKRGWHLTVLDRTLYIATALISLLVIFLWFFTSHYCTKYNLNILWASPLFIYFAFYPKRPSKGVAAKVFPCFSWIQLAMLLVAVSLCFIPEVQRINSAILWIALALACRLIARMKKPYNKEQ